MFDTRFELTLHRGEQNVANADRLSPGRRLEGEARSDADAMWSPVQRILHRSTPNRTDPNLPVLPQFQYGDVSQVFILIFFNETMSYGCY